MSSGGKLADKIIIQDCNANNKNQWFYLDQCHGNAHILLRDGQVPVLHPQEGVDINKDAEPYSVCQLVMGGDESKTGTGTGDGSEMCLDINGQNYIPGADLIG